MSILVRFAPTASVTTEQYDEVIRLLEEKGALPPDGQDYHCCFVADGNLRVSEIWDSQEQFEAFGPTLMPILEEAGVDPGEPDLLEIHNVIKR